MAGYRFFPAADLRQDEIWEYTCKHWGEKQAEKYIRDLHNHLQELADKKKLWRPLSCSMIIPSDIKINVYFSHYKRHYIFFRELSDDLIGVMSILHDSIDIPVRLAEDLQDIDNISGEKDSFNND